MCPHPPLSFALDHLSPNFGPPFGLFRLNTFGHLCLLYSHLPSINQILTLNKLLQTLKNLRIVTKVASPCGRHFIQLFSRSTVRTLSFSENHRSLRSFQEIIASRFFELFGFFRLFGFFGLFGPRRSIAISVDHFLTSPRKVDNFSTSARQSSYFSCFEKHSDLATS